MEELGSFCPSCGNNTLHDDNCTSCNFSLATIIKCPYKQDSAICGRTKTSCNISGTSFEVCEEFRGSDD